MNLRVGIKVADGSGIFDNGDAVSFVGDLRAALPISVGDRISAALIAVAHREGSVGRGEANCGLAAIGLLVSPLDPTVLEGLDTDTAAWFADLEVELNPARRRIAAAAISRILLPADNEWHTHWVDSGRLADALAPVHRLRDLLADLD